MKAPVVLLLALILSLAGCAMLGGAKPQAAPEPEKAVAPVQIPAAPEKAAFDPASLCGKPFRDYENKVFSVRPCTTGTSYVLYRECCGQPPAFVDSKGTEVSGDAEVSAACTADAGENICAKTLESEPMLCPSHEIGSCPDYSSPVCARIKDASGEWWFDYQNDCQACKEGKGTGGQVSYMRGECAARGIDTKAVVEVQEREHAYRTLVGKEITIYAQHYGLAGREVKITVARADITYLDKVVYNGAAAWRATIVRDTGNEEHSVYLYLDGAGMNLIGQDQNY